MRQDWLEATLAAEATAIDPAQRVTDQALAGVQRVAIFSEAFLPKVDGVTRTALLTIRYLRGTGREVIVFAPRPCLPDLDGTPIYGIPSLWLPAFPESRCAPPWPFALRRLRTFRPDLIHLFSPFSLGATGMIAGSMLKIPVVANYQTDLPGYTRSYGAGWLHSSFVGVLRFIHNGCHLNLAPTEATRAELRRWCFRRVRVWGRGVDTKRFRPERRSTAWRARLLAGRDPGRLLALYVGRLAKEKHLETLRGLAADPSIALTLVGEGEHRAEAARVLAGEGHEVHFVGQLIGDDLADAYAAADVFVFPGPTETFGQVVVEAMASGLPVIVTDRGGPATLLQDGREGFICPVDDAAAFRDRALLLHHDPARRERMGHAARHTTESQTWMRIMAQLEGFYAEALAMERRRQGIRA